MEKGIVKSSTSDNPYNEPMPMQEHTSRDSYMYPDSMFSPWNPDDLVRKHQDYSVYEEMLKDDQISVCLQIKKDLVLGSGFDFVTEEDGQEDIIEDLKIALCEDPEWAFEEMLEEIISAYEMGFSASEKIFKTRDDGKLSLRCIKTRYPGTWMFHTDHAGNIIRYEQIVSKKSFDIPKDVLIHYVNKRAYQNPYGTSDLRAAYQAWFTKKHVTRWYAVFIEKAASPIPIATYDKNLVTNEQEVTDIHNALKKFQTKTSMAIPEYFKVQFLESKSTGEAYIKGINLFNMFIGRSLLIPDLLGFQGAETGGGSYALGKTQMEVFFKHIRRRRELLEKTINNEIVWPVVLYNYGYVDNYPKFKFREISREDVMEAVKLWLDAAKAHVYKPSEEEIDHFRNILNFPSGEPVEIGQEEKKVEDPEVNVYPTKDGGDSYASKDRKYQPASGAFGNKTNFELLEKTLDTELGSFLANSNSLVDEIFSAFTEQIDAKSIIQKQKVDKLDSLTLKGVGSLRQKLKKSLFDLYKKSKELASSEIFKSSFAKPIVDEAFLKILEEELYQFVGDWEYNVTKGARLAIIQAIKDGKSITQVVDILEKETKDQARTSLERYARTKFTEVMNKGRLAFFKESKVVSGYQYSAVLDDRTCFSAGTLVRMADCSLKPIETIKPGEYVFSGSGNKRKVKARKIAIASNWREIKTKEETQTIRSTNTHPFWAYKSGGFSWLEAQNLDQGHRIGRIELRALQKSICNSDKQTEKILQSSLLLSSQKSCDDRKNVYSVQSSLSGSQKLVRRTPNRREILQQKVSSKKSNQRNSSKGIDKDLSEMRESISNKTRRNSKRFEQSTLQQGLSKETNNKTLSKLPENFHIENLRRNNLLQSGLLSFLGGGDKFRNRDSSTARATKNSFHTRSETGQIFNRFSSYEQGGFGSGRELLAPQQEGFGFKKREGNFGKGISTDSSQIGSMGLLSANTALARDCHEIIPTPTGSIGIERIETITETAFCYDLEIEEDHSYLVTESNLIAHNTEICRGLHGKIFKADDAPVPPNHFNCRSMLIPITIYEEFEPDTHVGKTPIEKFIEENLGKGFPKQ